MSCIQPTTVTNALYPTVVLTVTAFAAGGFRASVTLVLIVANNNMHPPVFTTPVQNAVTAPQTLLFYAEGPSFATNASVSFMASNINSGVAANILYSLMFHGTPSAAFQISPDGMFEQVTPLFFLDGAIILLDVVATNQGMYNISTMTTVQITVLPMNIHAPQFTLFTEDMVVFENAPLNHVFGSVVATDDDQGLNGTVFYIIVSVTAVYRYDLTPVLLDGSEYPLALGSTNGQVYLTASLLNRNYESLTVTIMASDRGTPAMVSLVNNIMTITVTDINNNAPMINIIPGSHGALDVPAYSLVPFMVPLVLTDADFGVNAAFGLVTITGLPLGFTGTIGMRGYERVCGVMRGYAGL